MLITWEVLAIAIPAVIFAGISKGGFGSGAAFASAAILALILPPGQALGVMLPLLMLIDLVTLKPYWRRWSWPDARVLILGGLPGVALGAALYQLADPDVFRLLIGIIALGFVLWQLLLRWGIWRAPRRVWPVWAGALVGCLAGFTSFVSHAGGPPAAVYLLSRRLGKTPFQATTVLTFWALNIAKAVPYGILGIFTAQTLLLDLLLAPAALLGAWIGVRMHFAIPERLFFTLTYVLLVLTGLRLIWDGMT